MSAAPGVVASVIRIDVRLLAGIRSGLVPVVLNIGESVSQPEVRLVVR